VHASPGSSLTKLPGVVGRGVEEGPSATGSSSATRERVEQAALGLFGSHGYVATSLREIAQAVGISVPAIYHHFTSKDDLLRRIVEPLLEAADDLLAELAAQPRGGFARRALEAYYDLIVGHRAIYLLVSSDPAVRGHPEVGPRVAAQSDRLLDLLAGNGADRGRRVRAAAATGALRRPLRLADVDPERDRDLIVSAALGALGTELVSPAEGSR
jgi:AcrR family transcriptional regulator